MTTDEEYYLICLAEEAGELAQAACKALRFGMSHVWPSKQKTNREAIAEELRDVVLLAERLDIYPGDSPDKGGKFSRMMELSRELGRLQR